MRARQIAGAHQELTRDLAAGEDERLLEELHPFRFLARMMCIEPLRERAVRLAQRENALRIFYGGVDFQAIADDAGVAEEAFAAAGVEARHFLECESGKCIDERLALFEDREPRKPGLIDLQHEALEEPVVITDRKAVF